MKAFINLNKVIKWLSKGRKTKSSYSRMFEFELRVVIGSLMKVVSSSILQVHVNLYGLTQQITFGSTQKLFKVNIWLTTFSWWLVLKSVQNRLVYYFPHLTTVFKWSVFRNPNISFSSSSVFFNLFKLRSSTLRGHWVELRAKNR